MERTIAPRSWRTVAPAQHGWILAGLTTAAGLSLALYNLYCLRTLRTTRLRISSPDLPSALDGVRIAHLSDFHLGQPGTSAAVIREAKRQAAAFQPDLVALTGDYVDGPEPRACAGLLGDWPYHTPIVAVLGNHDYVRGDAHLSDTVDVLVNAGVTVLRNQAIRLPLRGSHAWVVGIDDPFTLRDDACQAYAAVPECERALLLLAHAPVVEALGDLNRAHLALCGHTHGGQVRLLPSGRTPLIGLVRWLTREPGPSRDPDIHRGRHLIGSTPLIISEGLGVSSLPLRFRTRPELVLIELTRQCGRCLPPTAAW